MATRSNILAKLSTGSYGVSGIHWGGEITENGRLLLAHYNNPSLVDSLIKLGEISALGESIIDCEHFSTDDENNPQAEPYEVSDALSDLYDRCRQEYVYYWDGVRWYVKFNVSVSHYIALSPRSTKPVPLSLQDDAFFILDEVIACYDEVDNCFLKQYGLSYRQHEDG